MSDIGAVASAVSVAGEIALELLRPDQRKLIASAEADARRDCRDFTEALLNRNVSRVNLLLDGLQRTVRSNLTESEGRELDNISSLISGNTLLGLYQRARSADLAVAVSQIVGTTPAAKG